MIAPTQSIVTDLDHTIADAYWRDPLLGQWDAYFAASERDEPIPHVLEMLHLWHRWGWNVVCVTARNERWRDLTNRWMMRHNVPVDEMFMRPDDNHDPSRVIKPRLVRERFPDLSEVAWVLEDNAECCMAYREMGLNVLQVHLGGQLVAAKEYRHRSGSAESPAETA